MKGERVSRVPNLTIRPMTPGDLDEVMPVEEVSYAIPWKRPMFEAELHGNPFARLFTARDSEQNALLGYVCFWMVFDELHLLNLSVRPDRRRIGIGEELARWTLSWARENGARLATLEVRASNEAAKRLYEKLGFKVVAVRQGYYREPKEDAVIMNLTEW
ncbi:MAG: ribosomal protein S18-alanine N-acetyltransferase [Nitrospirae bacterium]|nr:ribosomal protein S18-alanine N-acetyltransferase [Nitrospirota bacterium]